MTRELARALDEEFAELTPPSELSGPSIVQKGRRVRARRRLVIGGAVAGAAALVAVALVSGLLPGEGSVAPPVAVAQPDYPLPALDPEADYVWSYLDTPPQSTDAAVATDEAWRAAVAAIEGAELFVNVEADSDPLPGGQWYPFSEDAYLPVARSEVGIFRVVGGTPIEPELEATGYTAPVFRGGRLALSFDGGEYADALTARVYPKGSFVPGAATAYTNPLAPDAPHLIPGCEDRVHEFAPEASMRVNVDYTCVEGVGPDGEQVLTVETSLLNEGEPPYLRETTVVLYRLDGTAVVVSDRLTGLVSTGQISASAALTLDSQDLLDLALALPRLPIA